LVTWALPAPEPVVVKISTSSRPSTAEVSIVSVLAFQTAWVSKAPGAVVPLIRMAFCVPIATIALVRFVPFWISSYPAHPRRRLERP
jgi:hypothetical protein